MKIILLALLLIAKPGFASPADYAIIKHILGTYSVLDFNNSLKIAGTLSIVADDNGVGIKAAPLKMTSEPVPALGLVSPKEGTELTRSGDTITQHYHSGNTTVRIFYHVKDGYLIVDAQSCVGTVCGKNAYTVTTGKAPGEPVDPKATFDKLKGLYKIELAGGIPPHATPTGEAPDTLEVDVTSDPKIATVWAPYCIPPNGPCTAGNQDFIYAKTLAYSLNLNDRSVQYVLLTQVGNKTVHYSWSDTAGKIMFRDHAYPLKGETVCLEHAIHKDNGDYQR